MSTAPLALLEVLDREGHVRQQMKVVRWPVRVGRALDNDWVLDDPHTAAWHFTLSEDDVGLQVQVGDTVNGLWVEQTWLAGQSTSYLSTPVVMLKAGETTLRLRLPGSVLPPEVRIEARPLPLRGRPVLLGTAALALGAVGLQVWLTSDPGELVANLGIGLLSSMGVLLAWSGLWALLCKVITRRSHFGWHIRVALLAGLAWELTRLLPGFVAFVFSWPWVSSFGFVLPLGVLAVTVAYHLRKIEPKHPGRRRSMAWLVLSLGLGLSLWSNQQAHGRWGQGLYLSQLYPPEWRLAPARELDTYMRGVAELQDALDDDDSEAP